MVTSFTRIIIVLHFVRSALGTQSTPPNQIFVSLALFLTFFIMSPVITKVNTQGNYSPYLGEKFHREEAFETGVAPIRTFMLEQTDVKDLRLFMDIAGIERLIPLMKYP